MLPISVLDLCPVNIGASLSEAFDHAVELAQTAENLGYKRLWYAEHHNMPGIASAATSVLMCHIGNHTSHIRLGAGGIMLPNHSPLAIAEQFGTLASLFGERIDLGLGRAPGTDPATMRALRRQNLHQEEEQFADEVVDMLQYFDEPGESRIQAIPGVGSHIPVWILGSSTYGAQLAAYLGLPYSFASHFAPSLLEQALHVYRSTFKPSKYLSKPYVMLAVNTVMAPTDAEAHHHFTSLQQAFLNNRRGLKTAVPTPVESMDGLWTDAEQAMVMQGLACSLVGSPVSVQQQLDAFRKLHQPDEIMVTQRIHDHETRLNTLRLFQTLDFTGRSLP